VINGERPGVLEVLALAISVSGNFIVAASSVKALDAPFWPLFLNLLAPFIGALCVSTLRAGVAGLFDPGNCLGGAMTKMEFTIFKLALACIAALLSAMLLENGSWSFMGSAVPWWTALGSYPAVGTALILASGILTSILHVTLAWLAWLTSAMAVGLLGEVKVLPQWILNELFGAKHALTSSYLLGAGLGIAGAILYAAASFVRHAHGKLILNPSGLQWQPVVDEDLPRQSPTVACANDSANESEGNSSVDTSAQSGTELSSR